MDTSPSTEMAFAALAEALWVERTLVEQLAFKHAALELVLGADLRRYVARCLDEVDATAELVEAADRRRCEALEEVAAASGRRADGLTLADLVAEAPEPWATVLAEHAEHLRALIREVATRAASTASLAAPRRRELDRELVRLRGARPLSALVAAETPHAAPRPGLRLVEAGAGHETDRP